MPDLAGTIPGWITAGSALSMLGLWLRYLTSRRQQDGVRLTDLEKENRQLRIDFDEYRAKCVTETDAQRVQIDGLRAQMLHLQMRGIAGSMEMPPATAEMFQRLMDRLGEVE